MWGLRGSVRATWILSGWVSIFLCIHTDKYYICAFLCPAWCFLWTCYWLYYLWLTLCTVSSVYVYHCSNSGFVTSAMFWGVRLTFSCTVQPRWVYRQSTFSNTNSRCTILLPLLPSKSQTLQLAGWKILMYNNITLRCFIEDIFALYVFDVLLSLWISGWLQCCNYYISRCHDGIWGEQQQTSFRIISNYAVVKSMKSRT